MKDGASASKSGERTPTGRSGRNYIVVSADTHASPDSLEHFLSYVTRSIVTR